MSRCCCTAASARRLLHWQRLGVCRAFACLAPDLRGYVRSSPREFEPGFYERDAADMAALLLARDARRRTSSAGATRRRGAGARRHPPGPGADALITIGGEARLLPEERGGVAGAGRRPPPGQGDRTATLHRGAGALNWPGILTKAIEGYNRVLDEDGGEIISRRLGEISCPTPHHPR
ncbi:MAG: hypothetical protein U0531_11380 [Dehalococcoidia bacterium]